MTPPVAAVTAVPLTAPVIRVEALTELPVFPAILTAFTPILTPILTPVLAAILAILASLLPPFAALLPPFRPDLGPVRAVGAPFLTIDDEIALRQA